MPLTSIRRSLQSVRVSSLSLLISSVADNAISLGSPENGYMRTFQWIACVGLFPLIACADDSSYEWVLEKYNSKQESAIVSSAVGQIDGEQFLAIITRHDLGERLTVFRRDSTRYVGIAQTKYMNGFPSYVSTVAVADDSLILESGYCHHGCYDYRYRFKNIDKAIRLVGVDSQNETLSCNYYGTNAPPQCEEYITRSGNSYNLLASTTICWLETVPLSKKVFRSYQPRGEQRKIALQQITLLSLEGFDLDNVSLPKSCNIDFKKGPRK